MRKDFTKFLGLKTSENLPEPNSALTTDGVVLDKIRGSIQNALGYGKVYDLPVPAVETLITNLSWKKAHRIHIPDHGGKDILLAAATYTKGDYVDGTSHRDTWGIWARPIWKNIVEDLYSTIESTFSLWQGGGNHANVTQSTDDCRSGAHSIKVIATGAGDGTTNYVNLDSSSFTAWIVAGSRYVLRFYVESLSSVSITLSIGGTTKAAQALVGTTSATHVFTQIEYEFTAATSGELRLWFSGATTAYIDDIEVLGWSDEWQELTESYAMKVVNVYSGSLGPESHPGSVALPSSIFNTQYLKDWSIVHAVRTSIGYGPVISCVSVAGGDYNFQCQGMNTSSEFTSGDIFYIMRNPAFRSSALGEQVVLSTSPTGTVFFDSVSSEARATPGTGENDFSLAVGFRQKTFGWSYLTKGLSNIDRLFVDTAQSEFYSPLIDIRSGEIGEVVTSGDVELPTGSYVLRASILYDDGQETQYLHESIPVVISTTGRRITYKYTIALGMLPRRARYIRIYMEKDGSGFFYLVKTLDMEADLGWEIEDGGISTVQLLPINGTDWSARGADESSQIGRDSANSGVVRYTRAAISGARRIVTGCIVDGVSTPNRAYVSAISGDGVSNWDSYPADGNTTIDVEYNDADTIVGIVAIKETLIVFKRHSIIQLLPDNEGGYSREVLASNVGLSSVDSLMKFEESWVWCDYNGIYMYGPGGLKTLNADWLSDYRAFTQAQKEGIIAGIDRNLRKYRAFIPNALSPTGGPMIYVYAFDIGQWLIESNESPASYVTGVNLTLDYLNGTSIYRVGSSQLRDGSSLIFRYTSNEILCEEGNLFDMLLDRFVIEFESTVSIQFSVTMDDSTSAVSDVLTAGEVSHLAKAHLSSLCNKFYFTFIGTINDESSSFEIKRLTMYYDILPSGRQ